MNSIECTKQKIRAVIAGSKVPEDPLHAENTLDWLLRLKPDADGISYFHVNMPLYYQREGEEETKRRCIWGYGRLSAQVKKIVESMAYADEKLTKLLQEAIREAHSKE